MQISVKRIHNVILKEADDKPCTVVLSSCTDGSKPDPDCDPALEAEVVKPDKCGKITDTTGPFR